MMYIHFLLWSFYYDVISCYFSAVMLLVTDRNWPFPLPFLPPYLSPGRFWGLPFWLAIGLPKVSKKTFGECCWSCIFASQMPFLMSNPHCKILLFYNLQILLNVTTLFLLYLYIYIYILCPDKSAPPPSKTFVSNNFKSQPIVKNILHIKSAAYYWNYTVFLFK